MGSAIRGVVSIRRLLAAAALSSLLANCGGGENGIKGPAPQPVPPAPPPRASSVSALDKLLRDRVAASP